MSLNPDISVIMSVHNGEKHLRESLDSILAQRGVSLELIAINDGSTDKCPEILDQYAQYDDRVRVIHQQNEGLTRSLIKGCTEARGQYIARHDVGDWSHPDRFFLQLQALNADQDLAFVSSWTEFRGPEGEFLYLLRGSRVARQPIHIISDDEQHGVVDGPTCHPSVMFRKDAYLRVGGYRPEFYYGQDWDLWYRLGEVGKFQIVEGALYTARIMPDSISMEAKVRQESISRLSRAALRHRRLGLSEQHLLAAASNVRPQVMQAEPYRRSRARALYFIGECLRQNGDLRALNYFNQATRHCPLFLKAWLRITQIKLFPNRYRLTSLHETDGVAAR